ncbi:MAG: hypothetical protein PHR53_09000 [Bacteroidales bacterium]|nr:hypothetical protein [Bacteroidales bacterium]
MKRITVLLVVFAFFLSSCAKKIDASSEETMQSSIEEIMKSLDDEKKEKFEESLQLIMFQSIDFDELLQDGGTDNTFSGMKSKVDGKTADDIIAEGEKIQAEIERQKKEQAKGEIEELYQKMGQAKKDKLMLAKFEVKRARFYKRKDTYLEIEEPIIELTVMNGTDKAVSRAYFTGTLASPNRSIPWIKDDFNYEISGGLEPGEEVTWYLAPNMFSDWGDVNAPKDAILTIEVKQLDGADGEEMYSVNCFGEDEQERLKELLANYPEFQKIM